MGAAGSVYFEQDGGQILSVLPVTFGGGPWTCHTVSCGDVKDVRSIEGSGIILIIAQSWWGLFFVWRISLHVTLI